MRPTTPHMQHPTALTHTRFRLLRFRSPLLTKYLFQQVLRCFTSPRHHPPPINSKGRRPETTRARFPHSDTLGSQLASQLPEAYRRLQRPSSAHRAKASTERPKTPTKNSTKTRTQPTKKRPVTHTQNCRKMLASTIRFTTTTPTPHNQPHNKASHAGSTGTKYPRAQQCAKHPTHNRQKPLTNMRPFAVSKKNNHAKHQAQHRPSNAAP